MEVIIDGVRYRHVVELSDATALDVNFYCDDLECTLSIREYLIHLLQTLWSEEMNFNSKRPFGNPRWQYDIYDQLVKYGYIKDIDSTVVADKFITGLINQLGK